MTDDDGRGLSREYYAILLHDFHLAGVGVFVWLREKRKKERKERKKERDRWMYCAFPGDN